MLIALPYLDNMEIYATLVIVQSLLLVLNLFLLNRFAPEKFSIYLHFVINWSFNAKLIG